MMSADPLHSGSRFRHELRTVLVFCVWLLLLGPFAQVFLWTAMEGFPVSWEKLVHRYVLILVHFLCYAPLFCGGLVLIRSRQVRLSWVAAGLAGAGLALLCSVCALRILILSGIKPAAAWPGKLLESISAGIAMTALVLSIERLYHSMVTSRIEAHRRELDRERAQRTAIEAQWNSLESRVRPHFLFNTLNSIRELMHRNAAEADVMIQRFANLIRFSLDSSRNTLVALQEELRTVSQYLEIEKMRLGSRLTFQVSMTPECSHVRVPSLSVLTLAENSVKHAVACRRSGGFVAIDAQIEDGRLRIGVCDDGPGFDESGILPGHGLDLLLRRLENLYPGETVFHLNPVTGKHAQVMLLIPIAASAAGPAIATGGAQDEQTPLLPRRR
jgi:sensor histidine kinase YesM